MVNAAVVALHLEQPLQLKAHLVQHIRDAVPAFGNVPVVTECFRRGPKRQKQIGNGFTGGHNIPSVIACVVPATGYLEERIRMEHTSRLGMTCRVRKYARAGGIQHNAAALQVKHASNWFNQRLRHETPLYVGERLCSARENVVVNAGCLLIGDAFHKIRLQTRRLQKS